jgi:acetoacetyl-CoA synthetase
MTQEGEWLWSPQKEMIDGSAITQFMGWLAETRGLNFASYADLHAWSVKDLDGYWSAIWDYFQIQSDRPFSRVYDRAPMPETKWFEGARINYAEHLLSGISHGNPDRTAIISVSEARPRLDMSWRELTDRVKRLATSMRALGLEPGDRVVSYMPNAAETVVAMLATVAIGCIWSSAAPEFGTGAVIDRFSQISPKLMFAADGYRFNGRDFDRRTHISEIAGALTSLKHIVWLSHLDSSAGPPSTKAAVHQLAALWEHDLPPAPFEFVRVEHHHPLWILFSSGTTGLPKAIVHSQVGMLVTHLSTNTLHTNLDHRSRLFFYTTTGWMVFNVLVSALLGGGSIVTYDGSPVYPTPEALWKLAADTQATAFGASPTFVQGMQKLKIEPGKLFDLSHLDLVICTGSPAQPETFAWFYSAVKQDMRVSSSSGGTDICSSIVGGLPILPVYAGEIQCPTLGIDARAFDDAGRTVVGKIGELVIAAPAPSMPLYFWNDPDKRRYRDSYFNVYPGIWRHGDFIKFNERGGSIIYGRSDSTLNRHGVRIGTAEIYRCVEQIPDISDSLVVCLEKAPGEFYMPLFIKLQSGRELDDDLRARINSELRTVCSPRHVPDEIHVVKAIPYTLSGKKMEIPVRSILEGRPADQTASKDAMADARALDDFIKIAQSRVDAPAAPK